MRNSKSYIVGCLADSVLKVSTEIDVFMKHLQNWIFSKDSPVQCYPEKGDLMQNFCSCYLLERFSEWFTTLCTLRQFEPKNSGIGLIDKL